MATIKLGFDDKPVSIRFEPRGSGENIGVTIEQKGLEQGAERVIQRYETLSYATLGELIALRDEINQVLAEVVGIK